MAKFRSDTFRAMICRRVVISSTGWPGSISLMAARTDAATAEGSPAVRTTNFRASATSLAVLAAYFQTCWRTGMNITNHGSPPTVALAATRFAAILRLARVRRGWPSHSPGMGTDRGGRD